MTNAIVGRRVGIWLCWVSLALALPASAQEAEDADVERLLDRIEQLEKKVTTLEAGEKDEPDAKKAAPKKDDKLAKKDAEKKKEDEEEDDEEKEDEKDGIVLELPWSMKLKLSGKARVRGEYRDNADYRVPGTFGRPAGQRPTDATDFVLLRTRLTFDLQVTKHLRAMVELQDARRFGDQAIGADAAEIHLRQGFLEVERPLDVPLWLRAGRWEVPSLGDSRLLSSLDWSNVTRFWDGFQAVYRHGYREKEVSEEAKQKQGYDPKKKEFVEDLWVSLFAANIREGAVFAADRDENDDFWFSGVYVSARMVPDHELDAYLFWRHLSDRIFTSERSTRLGDRKDFTLGFRFKGKLGPLGYSGEAAWQWGDQAGDRIRSWAAASRLTFKIKLADEMAIVFKSEYAYARGDRDPDDGKLQTFDPLLPFGHYYHGHMDLIGWSNLHAGLFGVKFQLFKGLSFHADGHAFWVDKRKDAWFNPGKRGVRRDPTGKAPSYIGTELDLFFKYQLWERLAFWGGYSHFWTGPFVRHTAKGTGARGSGDQDWVFLQAELKF